MKSQENKGSQTNLQSIYEINRHQRKSMEITINQQASKEINKIKGNPRTSKELIGNVLHSLAERILEPVAQSGLLLAPPMVRPDG